MTRRDVQDCLDALESKISERCAALPDLDTRPTDEILGYDERGLLAPIPEPWRPGP